ncbi:hypothetical protein CYMTET_8386 [Cymbomonas tetramitiformis]|uniref:Reverse transcriptase domain-containing protein n=1 Tax=Cymbomonas tetramitiformis TaxID=36881 RepID=A0AAE0LG17_9CHLO|nr:hypothetical protein CYMTET_8386 [Cymbomonas tetramitiformis]
MNVDGMEKEILPPFPEAAFEDVLQAKMRDQKAKAEVPFTPEQKAKLQRFNSIMGNVSETQKGFIRAENGTAAQVAISKALNEVVARGDRRPGALPSDPTALPPLRQAFIDYHNAFGSVEHALIERALHQGGVPVKMVRIIMCFYSTCKVAFQTGEGVSDFVEQLRGIVQGCPLSPTLFILVIDLLIQYVKFKDFKEVKVGEIVLALLAFADDIKLFARAKEELQRLFEALRVFSEWANLTIKIEKCGQLTIPKLGQHGSRAVPVGSALEIDGSRVPVVGKLGYPYLGCFEAERLSAVPNIGHIEKKLEAAVKQMEVGEGSAGGLREYATFLEQHIVAVSTYTQFQTQSLNGAWAERMDDWIIGKLRMKILQVSNFSASTIGTLVSDIHMVKKRWGGTGIARLNRARESTAVAAAVGLLEQGDRLECVAERFNLEHYAKTYGRTPESPHFKDQHGNGL